MTRRFTLSEAHARAQSAAGGLSKKHPNAWFFSHYSHEREGVRSLFLSLVSEDFFESSASDDSDRRRTRIQERGKISNDDFTRTRTFFILDLRFHVIDGIRRLHFQGDGFARQGFHENLHLLRLLLVLICVTCLCVYFLVARVNF
jgi:hypothetical protein|tara:strand:- start:38 stop:472 length:435 start_codon:yes stop_codon:yes gene_type:complete